jgi:hypothetical protein
MSVGGFGGLAGPSNGAAFRSLHKQVMSSLRTRIDEGIQSGNTKTMKINPSTGEPKESNGLNTIGSISSIDITV